MIGTLLPLKGEIFLIKRVNHCSEYHIIISNIPHLSVLSKSVEESKLNPDIAIFSLRFKNHPLVELVLSLRTHNCQDWVSYFIFSALVLFPSSWKGSCKHISWMPCFSNTARQRGPDPRATGSVSSTLDWKQLPVSQLVELCSSSQAEQLEEIWCRPHCLVPGTWFTPPRYWILICYICLLNSAFLLPFLRMKSTLFSAQSKNRLVIKFSFSFSFEAFMSLKLIYMLYILNKV